MTTSKQGQGDQRQKSAQQGDNRQRDERQQAQGDKPGSGSAQQGGQSGSSARHRIGSRVQQENPSQSRDPNQQGSSPERGGQQR